MDRGRCIVSIMMMMAIIVVAFSGLADPSVTILSPEDGHVSPTSLVTFSGTSEMSDATWVQSGASDLMNGSLDNVLLRSDDLCLQEMVSEDFNDDVLNVSLWTIEQTGGGVTDEVGGKLRQSIQNTGSGYWNGWTKAVSGSFAKTTAQAELVKCSGAGSAWGSFMALYESADMQVMIGIVCDPPAWGSGIWLLKGEVIGGIQKQDVIGPASGMPYDLRLERGPTKVDIYVNDTWVGSSDVTFDRPSVMLTSTTRASGDWLETRWDNASWDAEPIGTYTSAIHDTGLEDTAIVGLQVVDDAPEGTNLTYEVRSSRSFGMFSPTSWYGIEAGEGTVLIDTFRYIQFRATFLGNGTSTPSLSGFSLSYQVPIETVELSIDGVNWTVAGGTSDWSASLYLPEGVSSVQVRAMDALGRTSLSSVSVDVDTLPPAGSVIINGGNLTTGRRKVVLSLPTSDPHNVTLMLVSNSPYLEDAEWAGYAPSLEWTLLEGEGERTVYARFQDSLGHISDVVSDAIEVDTLPPVGSVTIDEGNRTSDGRAVVLSLPASDPHNVTLMLVGNSLDLAGSEWTEYRPYLEWTLSEGDGEKTVYASFQDGMGHISDPVNDTIELDTLPPIGSVIINDGDPTTDDRAVVLSLPASDPNDVEMMLVSNSWDLAGSEWMEYQVFLDWTLTEGEGEKTVFARFRDGLGHMSDPVNDTIELLSPVVDQPPVPVIGSPTDGTVVDEGTPLLLSAQGSSDDGLGAYPEPRFTWTSSIDGLLGTGFSLWVNLSVGAHTIVLFVDDGTPGHNMSTSITVEVREEGGTDDRGMIFLFILIAMVLLVLGILGIATFFMLKRKREAASVKEGSTGPELRPASIGPAQRLPPTPDMTGDGRMMALGMASVASVSQLPPSTSPILRALEGPEEGQVQIQEALPPAIAQPSTTTPPVQATYIRPVAPGGGTGQVQVMMAAPGSPLQPTAVVIAQNGAPIPVAEGPSMQDDIMKVAVPSMEPMAPSTELHEDSTHVWSPDLVEARTSMEAKSAVNMLKELGDMKQSGLITDGEFETSKKRLLRKI